MKTRLLPLLLLSLAFTTARAEVTVLVHGWASNADTWLYSGVVPTLASSGWRDAGVLIPAQGGVVLHGPQTGPGEKDIYRAHLPAEAPLLFQAEQLLAELRYVRQRHPDDKLTLVGHSAGGLVARAVLLRNDAPRIDALVTIATPNLGTVRALQGLDYVDSKPVFCPGPGIDILKSFVGGDTYDYLDDSRGALIDLSPGSLSAMLNQLAHPDIAYHALIRVNGDELVPAFSQDLNQVPALAGRARVYPSSSGHSLNPGDGLILAEILN